MSVAAPAITASPARVKFRLEWEPAAAWLLGFAPTIYLALSGGGYDIVVRSEVGIVVWWVILLGVLVGVLPRTRFGAPAWTAVLLLGGFLAWTWLAVGWSSSEENTLAEAARISMYLGVLVLGLALLSRTGLQPLLSGLACAVAVVCGLAVLSRLEPSWFPADSAAQFYATLRLRYPFDYSDGVGEFAALGLPLLLYVATGARTIAARVLAAAGLPVVVLCLALTVSRGGIGASAVGLVVFFALVPDRLPRLATGLAAAVASGVVMVALLDRAGVRNVFKHAAPASQRHSMLVVLLLSCVAVGVVQWGITLAVRHGRRPRALIVSRGQARAIAAAIAGAVVAVVIVGVAAGTVRHLWNEFEQPTATAPGDSYFRLLSIAGSHRYQYWAVAIHAFDAHPWDGIGPGTFQYYWSQHQTLGEFVRNAHSLYVETLAELGIIGVALIGGLFALVMIAGTIKALRATPPVRLVIATAVAGFAAFAAAASFDWVWQIGVMPWVGLLLAAAALGSVRDSDRIGVGRRLLVTRVLLGAATIAALWAIVVPLSATIKVRQSQSAALAGQYKTALDDAATAQRIEPSAASPRLQRALILEQLGDVPGARQAIVQAAVREPTNWRIWLIASRIATESDQPRVALADYEHARSLNPTSPIFR